VKALAGRTGGAVCTSSNAPKVVEWARKQGKKILFVPDQHLGRNTAAKVGMDLSKVVALPDPQIGRGGDQGRRPTVAGGSRRSTAPR
jgi:quinolinate synthase